MFSFLCSLAKNAKPLKQNRTDIQPTQSIILKTVWNAMPSIIATNSTVSDSVSDETPGPQPKWLDVLQYTMFTAIFVISVIGNTLVCLVIARAPRMRTTRNFLLVNLAVADLTVALLCIPFEVVLKITYPRWPLGSAMCKILWPTMTSVTTCSSATLVAISYDR